MPLDRTSSLRDLINGDAFVTDEVGAVPPGGTGGQVLAKASSDDRDTEWVAAGEVGGVTSEDITTIVVLTQAAYDLLTPDAETLYVIVG